MRMSFEQFSCPSMMYPLRSSVGSGINRQAGWGMAMMSEKLEEDVGRLLAELRLGTTAVEMN